MLIRFLIAVHRWLGVGLCLLFLLWFPSGIGMVYWGMPAVRAVDRFERWPALDPAKVVLSPQEAADRIGERPPLTEIRLNTFDGRPAYRFGERVVYADTGEEQGTAPLPLPVPVALMHDADATRHYIDPKTATIVRTYSDRHAARRWLYNGLHSFNFPWLYNHRPLWDIVVIAFMLGGTALCGTAIVLAWRAVGKKLRRTLVLGPGSCWSRS